MNINTSFFEGGEYNIVSPGAQWQPDLVHYPAINDWNTILLNCFQNNSWESHWELHLFFQRWNDILDEGWLRVLLSKQKYERNIVERSFYSTHLNEEETVLLLLLEYMLRSHQDHIQEAVTHRVQSLSKAFKKTKQSLSAVLRAKKRSVYEGSISNLKQLLKQSLYWRNTSPDDDYKNDPLLQFINSQTENGLSLSAIKKNQKETGEDPRLTALITTQGITSLFRYLLAGKNKNLDVDKILNGHLEDHRYGNYPAKEVLTSSKRAPNICENNIKALGRSLEELSLQAHNCQPVQVHNLENHLDILDKTDLIASFKELSMDASAEIKPSISNFGGEAINESLAVNKGIVSVNQSFSGVNHSQANEIDENISTKGAEASSKISTDHQLIKITPKKRGGI
jgi:hypothetical protein